MPIVFIVFSVIYKEDAASEKLMSCKISDLNKWEGYKKYMDRKHGPANSKSDNSFFCPSVFPRSRDKFM